MAVEIIIGTIASALTAVSAIPQFIKLIKEKKANDISALMLCVLLTGLGLWVYYGVIKNDLILIASNSISFLINLWVLILAIVYKGK